MSLLGHCAGILWLHKSPSETLQNTRRYTDSIFFMVYCLLKCFLSLRMIFILVITQPCNLSAGLSYLTYNRRPEITQQTQNCWYKGNK